MNDISFENCTECTVCTAACPVSRANPDCSGPKQAGPDGECLRLKDGALCDEALKYYISCKHYKVTHSSDVKIGDIIQRAQARYGITRPSLRNLVLSHTDLMGSVSTPFTFIVNTATSLKLVRQLLDAMLKVNHRHTLPKYPLGTFRCWHRSVTTQRAQYRDQVALLHGHLVNYNHPQLSKNLTKMPSAMGTGIQLLSKEKCYDVPLIASGFTDKTRKQAITNVELIREVMGVKGILVIAASSTYTFALRDECPEALNVDNKGLRDHVKLTTRWLWRKLDEGKMSPLKPLPLKMVYHTLCHMEKVGWTSYALELSCKIPGLELTMLDPQCCDIMGIHGSKKENYPTSQVIDAPLFRQIEESGANPMVIDCKICKWQIEMSTNLCCEHPIIPLVQALV